LLVIGAILPFIETAEAEGVKCAALFNAVETASPKSAPSAKQ
jgi:hypothetical protein